MAARMSEGDDWVGVPVKEFFDTLRKNVKSFDVIWSDPDLVSKYPQKWIAAFDGKVQLVEEDLESLLQSLKEHDVPRGQAVIEFVEENPRTLILNVNRRLQDLSREAIYAGMDTHTSSRS
ncbi:MAG: DUF5678 domain-containing protein [Gammaproteobacteria bacterium]|nr:DUF5678 domain-containing protein [Gammaproteobacteria bacterium]